MCSVEGCDEIATERGWCHGHYLRWCRLGDVQPDIPLGRRRQPGICTVEGCNRDTNARGLCRTHHQRLFTFGDVRADLPIRVVTGEGSLSHGYWKVAVPPELRHLTNGETQIGEHRLVMAQHLGRALYPDEVVHHKNGNRTDNRIENLELWLTYQPKGQRVEDKLEYAREIFRRYLPEQERSAPSGRRPLISVSAARSGFEPPSPP